MHGGGLRAVAAGWQDVRKQLGMDVKPDYDLTNNRFFPARHPRAPIYLWLALDNVNEDHESSLLLGYATKPDAGKTPGDLACFVRGPNGMGRLDLGGVKWSDMLLKLGVALRSCASSPDWEEEESPERRTLNQLSNRWSDETGLFEAGKRMETDLDPLSRKRLILNAHAWNGDLDRLVHYCFEELSFRSSPSHIRNYLEQIIPELVDQEEND